MKEKVTSARPLIDAGLLSPGDMVRIGWDPLFSLAVYLGSGPLPGQPDWVNDLAPWQVAWFYFGEGHIGYTTSHPVLVVSQVRSAYG